MASPVDPQTPFETSPSFQNGVGDKPGKKRKRQTAHSISDESPHRRQAACQPCRLRKIKCDKRRPSCNTCASTGANCEYTGESLEVFSLENAVETLLHRLDYLQQSVDQLNHDSSLQDPNLGCGDSAQKEAHPASPVPQKTPILDSSKDFLQIPPHKTSADAVLSWDIFENKYPNNALVGVLFEPEQDEGRGAFTTFNNDVFNAPAGLKPPDDEKIPQLVDNFLQNVHTKNPI